MSQVPLTPRPPLPQGERGSLRPIHVVQIGSDASVFASNAASDTMRRQRRYLHALRQLRPGSRLTTVVLTQDPTHRRIDEADGALVFIPLLVKSAAWRFALFRLLLRLAPVDVLAPQNVFDQAWVALAAGWWLRARVVGQVHFDIFSPQAQRENLGAGWRVRLKMALAQWGVRRMAAVRVVGRRVEREVLRRGWHDNVHVLPVAVTMGPSLSRPFPHTEGGRAEVSRGGVFSPRSLWERALGGEGKHGEEDETKAVLFVGRLVEQKNLHTWLAVAQQVGAAMPGARFVLVGDGPLRAQLEAKAATLNLGDRVCFTGLLPYEALPDIYTEAAVFLLTSGYEGFGRVIVEAALYGVPTVATRVTGPEDIIIDGETGFLHALDDVDGMAASVLALLGDTAMRDRMGAAARAHVQRLFDPDRLAHEWAALWVSEV